MLPAARRSLAAFDMGLWSPRAGTMFATLATNVNHAVLGMLLAVHYRLAALDIGSWYLRARGMCVTFAKNVLTMRSSACCLQCAAVCLPSTLDDGTLRKNGV